MRPRAGSQTGPSIRPYPLARRSTCELRLAPGGPALPRALSRRRGAKRTRRSRGNGQPGDAIRLARLVPSLRQLRPEHPPRATRREQPVGLTTERAEELFLEALTPEIDRARQIRMEILDQRLRHDAADPYREGKRKGRRAHGCVEEPRVFPPKGIGEIPAEIPHDRVHQRRDRPFHDLVADVAEKLGQVERRRRPPPRMPEVRDVIEHSQIPARVLSDHTL